MRLTDLIERQIDALPAAEQRVGHLILQDPRAAMLRPVAELAALAQVSNPTVVRFCRSMGFEGWRDFKLQLAASQGSSGTPFVHQRVQVGDTGRELVHKVASHSIDVLRRFAETASQTRVEQAVSALSRTVREGGRIEFHGVGASGIVAQDAQLKFHRMGGHATAVSDGHLQIIGATLLNKADCLVVISSAGRSQGLIDALEVAKRQGATTVAITATGSPLASMARIHLAADHAESYEEFSPMASRLLQLLIVDILATGVALQSGPDLPARLRQVKRNLISARYRSD